MSDAFHVDTCEKCPALVACRTQIVQGVGREGAKIMLIGQNPGKWEDEQGIPFVGKTGKLLAAMCEKVGIPTSSLYRTNAVRCWTPGNRTPKREEIENCRPYLIEEIKKVRPQIIVALGDTALQALYGIQPTDEYKQELVFWENECAALTLNRQEELSHWVKGESPKPKAPKMPKKPRVPKKVKTTIKDVAGHTLIQPDTGIPMISTYHPAFLMRGKWNMIELVTAHLAKADRIARGVQGVSTLSKDGYPIIETIGGLKALRDYLLNPAVPVVWYDTETTGLNWMEDELLCISFSGEAGSGYVLPIYYNPGNGIPELFPEWAKDDNLEELITILKEIFGSDKPKGGQNVLFDIRFLERDNGEDDYVDAYTAWGIKVNGRIIDTELTHHAIAESLPHNMTSNLAIYTDMEFYESKVKGRKKDMGKLPNKDVWPYSGADADGLPRLYEAMRPIAEEEGVNWVLDNITTPLIHVCREIEKNGFPVNEEYFNRLNQFYVHQIELEEEKLWTAVPHREPGWKYNYAPTLSEVLFKELKYPVSGRKTKSSRGCEFCLNGTCFDHDQTGKDALEDILIAGYGKDILPIIIRLKHLTKRHSTYLAGGKGGMKRYIRADTRIHSWMKNSRAETGRLASEHPNNQNIPNMEHIHPIDGTCKDENCTAFYQDDFGIDTTNAFHDIIEAGPGKGIMDVDWSQLEIWVLAYRIFKVLDDRTLLDVLESGVDIHLWMARKMFPDLSSEMSDKEWRATYPGLRRRAKTSNFGIGYGLTVQGFMLRERCTEQEAEETISRFKAIVPIERYFKSVRKDLNRYDGVYNEFGRKRHINYLSILKVMREPVEFEAVVREAINFPIQGGGSDLHSAASYATVFLEALRNRGCHVILSVHDSLTFEFDWPSDEYAEQTAWIIKNLWQGIAWNMIKPDGEPLNWRVPVECEWGKTWGSPTKKLSARGVLEEV